MIFADIQGIVTHVRYRIFLPGLPGQIELSEVLPRREETRVSLLRKSFFSADGHRRAAGIESSKPRGSLSNRRFPSFNTSHPTGRGECRAFAAPSSRDWTHPDDGEPRKHVRLVAVSSDAGLAKDLSKIRSSSDRNHRCLKCRVWNGSVFRHEKSPGVGSC